MSHPSVQDLASVPSVGVLTSDGDGPATPTWVVALGSELYVRPVPGGEALPRGGGHARARAAGVEHHVALAEVAPEVHDLLDAAYRTKYGRCAPEKVAAVVSDAAASATFRLTPRRPSVWERAVPLLDAVGAWWRRARTPRRRPAEVPCAAC